MFVDRRAFFRSLGGALRDEPAPRGPAARPASRLATPAALDALALECGVPVEHVRALARVSVRLTPARERTGSFLGGAAEAAIDLRDVARLVGTVPPHAAAHVTGTVPTLPDAGTLWCFRDRVLVNGDSPQGAVALSLSAELTLPRVWSAPVQALELTDPEMTGWEELRARLADLQGVERKAPDHVMRLLGYPEDRTGDMPALCEARARDSAAGHGDMPALCEARARDSAAGHGDIGADRWRLLLQLPAEAGKRRFVWVPSPGELACAVAIVR